MAGKVVYEELVAKKGEDTFSQICLTLAKKGIPYIVWLLIKNWDGKGIHKKINLVGKFALYWEKEANQWTEKQNFEEYGVLKGVDYWLPEGFENTSREILKKDSSMEINWFSYFNQFKLPINSLVLDSETGSVPTVTTKQNRVPNSGLLANS